MFLLKLTMKFFKLLVGRCFFLRMLCQLDIFQLRLAMLQQKLN
jgi:hypothetical protein